jgi:putative PIG3 family NAD(P)H quinone oxidoreductase
VRAVQVGGSGRPEDLHVAEVPEPEPRPGEVVLQVEAAGVNRADLLQRRGRYPPPPGESTILGLEAAGTVRALGEGVAGWATGDRAMALLAGGGYAERVAVPAGQLMPIPAGWEAERAAAVPEAFVTAWLSLHDLTHLGPRERLLVHAAASGVGTAALQIGRALGAETIGTTRSPEKARLIEDLGARAVVIAADGQLVDAVRAAAGGRGVDVVLDLVGAALWPQTVRCLAEGARVSVVGLMGGSRIELDLAALMGLQATITGSTLRRRSRAQKVALVGGFWEWAGPLFAAGRLRPLVDRVLPWEHAGDAHRLLEDNATSGKLVLSVGK